MKAGKKFYGKYRGKVADNIDPLFLGRILPIVPAVSELPLTWATPCVPYAGLQVGFYALPPIGANIWIEFEGGDPNHPIWSGCFWEEGQVPLGTPAPGMTILKTEFITLILNDDPELGGLTLEITPPAVDTPITLTLNSTGVELVTEALLSLTSNELNIASSAVTVESEGDVNIASNVLSIETEETNIASSVVTIESEETNIASSAVTIESEETNIASAATTIESEEVNIAGAMTSIESAETNIASAATTVESVGIALTGLVEVNGDLLIDGLQPVVI